MKLFCNIVNSVLSLRSDRLGSCPTDKGNPFSLPTSFERDNINGLKMKEIKLTQGMVALVDDEDFEYLNQWRWHACRSGKTFCARRISTQTNYVRRSPILLHRVIMNTPKDMQCDHINHNGLDNRKCNLRNCTCQENLRNRRSTGSVKYTGVSMRSTERKFWARICVDGISISLGWFVHAWAAAIAYDRAAKKYFGEFANLNFKP